MSRRLTHTAIGLVLALGVAACAQPGGSQGDVASTQITAQEPMAEVATRMGVDRAYISSIERGGQNATLLSLNETALALGVKPADLLAEPSADSEA